MEAVLVELALPAPLTALTQALVAVSLLDIRQPASGRGRATAQMGPLLVPTHGRDLRVVDAGCGGGPADVLQKR